MPVFGCKTFAHSGFFAIVTAYAVSLFVLSGLAQAFSVKPYSVSKMSGPAREETVVESGQTDNKKTYKEVREIRVECAEEGEEKVFFLINGFYPPRRIALSLIHI